MHKMTKYVAISIGIIGLMLLVQPTEAITVLEGEGRAYPVSEKSQSERIREKLKNKKKEPKKKVDRYKRWAVRLKKQPPIAKQNKARTVDITYTLPFDIQDENGKIILPKGFKYNPLEDIPNMTSLIVIDGENEDHIKWAKEKLSAIPGKTMILISKGSYLKVRDDHKMRVFHLDDNVMGRYQVERVPCTVIQKGLVLEVNEYAF